MAPHARRFSIKGVRVAVARVVQLWKQTFTNGYVQQAFTRMTVSEGLKHGEANAPYLQRSDILRAKTGLSGVKVESDACKVRPSLREAMAQADENA